MWMQLSRPVKQNRISKGTNIPNSEENSKCNVITQISKSRAQTHQMNE